MEPLIQAAALGIIGVVLIALLRHRSGELALLLSLGVCVLIGLLLVTLAEPVVDFFTELQDIAGLDNRIMAPMLKTIGIGMITQIASNICSDGGESAVARMIELCGAVLALCVAIPLMQAVLDLIRGMSGG